MPHQNQFSFQNRGFLGGAVPRHQIGPGGPPRPTFPRPGDPPGFTFPGPGKPIGGRPGFPIRSPGDSPFQQFPFNPDQGTTSPITIDPITGHPIQPGPFPGGPEPTRPPESGRPSGGGGGGGLFDDDFIKELFGEQPELAFFGALNNQRQNFTPVQNAFFPTQFNQFQNRFFGQLGNQIQGGTPLSDLPTFSDFLGGINFQDEFRSLPPSLRPGSSTARFRPPTQFRF